MQRNFNHEFSTLNESSATPMDRGTYERGNSEEPQPVQHVLQDN
jgi:hypothetical protein